MKRVNIIAVGRLKEASWRHACDDYYKRCSRLIQIKEKEARDLRGLKAEILPRSFIILLDERGKQYTSRSFAALLQDLLEKALSDITFIIGGPDGVDDEVRRTANITLSLGTMTFAHRIVRVMLAEQLYRAVSIIEGMPYHRD
jgi:23S rRNA (pseudouridine1915-N3)-methyltransferase